VHAHGAVVKDPVSTAEGSATQQNRISIAYLSRDFGDHPTSHMIEGVIRTHTVELMAGGMVRFTRNKSRVTPVLVHYGPINKNSTALLRLQLLSESNGHFVMATELSDGDAIERTRRLYV